MFLNGAIVIICSDRGMTVWLRTFLYILMSFYQIAHMFVIHIHVLVTSVGKVHISLIYVLHA